MDDFLTNDAHHFHVPTAQALLVSPSSHPTTPSEPFFRRCSVIQCPYLISLPADGILVAWLDDKTGKSHSWKTHVAYHATALSLRAALQVHGYELFYDLTDDTHYAAFLLIVQQWAGARAADSHHRGPISPATYNHRLAPSAACTTTPGAGGSIVETIPSRPLTAAPSGTNREPTP